MEVVWLLLIPVQLVLKTVENFLFLMISWYDEYCYSPLQKTLSPIVAKIPRSVKVNGNDVNVFTANVVSLSRTVLVIPVAWCLKYDYCVTASLLMLLHDFLDHLDGIVAKVQKSIYGPVDDPILGSFMDAFCDKIVNVFALWSVLMVTDFADMSWLQTTMMTLPCVVIISYEFVLGVVRVQDYFRAHYQSLYGAEAEATKPNLAAVMEGKLKEKLESLGIAFLCLAQGSASPGNSVAGIAGAVCLILSFRLAHASLEHKLKARRNQPTVMLSAPERQKENSHLSTKNSGASESEGIMISVETQVEKSDNTADDADESDKDSTGDSSEDGDRDGEEEEEKEGEEEDEREEEVRNRYGQKIRSLSVPNVTSDKVDRIYTVGCFDLFHEGHVILLQRLRSMGNKVIVGVHDSRSIFKLKKRVPIHGTTKRMSNVKKYADVVFCVHGTDPTPYLACAFDKEEGCRSLYVRGDDMPDFPARQITERLMPIKFLPYTKHVSSTKIRQEVYSASQFGPHVRHDDYVMFY